MSKLYFLPLRPAFDSAGITVPGSQHWFTLVGSNTPSAPFADAALTVPLENPIIANGIGYLPPVYLNESVSYCVRVYLPHARVGVDTPLEEYDPYEPTAALLTYLGSTGFEGLLKDAASLIVPDGTDLVSTTGADETDHGGANYVAGTAPTARSGFTSANTRNFVLSKEQVIVPQQFYQATDPDFQNAAQGAFDYHAAIAGDVVNPWYRSASKIVFPSTTIGYDFHAPLEPGYTGIFEGEDTGFHDTHATKMRWSAGNSSGWRFQDINTTGASGTNADHFAPSGSILRNMFLEGGLDAVATEGEYHAVHARTRVIVENVGVSKWQGDGINITADLSAGYKGEASLSQISRCRILRARNGVAVIGADANIVTLQSVDVVYARRWGFDFRDFLGVNPQANHTAGCGFFNPGYVPSLCSYLGNTYGVVDGQEVGASTNAPSGGTTDTPYWYYCYAGGPSAPLNIIAWTSGLTWDAGGPYHVNGAGSPTTLLNCYSETGMGPSQIGSSAMVVGGLHGAGVKGAHFGAHNGLPTAIKAITAEKDGDTSTRTSMGSGEDSADGAILSHFNPNIGGANVLGMSLPTFSPNVLYWSNWRGSFSDNLVPFQISMNGASVGDAPWGRNRFNAPNGLGISYKPFVGGTAAPTGAMVGGGNWPVGSRVFNTAPAVGSPKGWICTVAGSPGTWVSEGNL
jgi:hypothetical protein